MMSEYPRSHKKSSPMRWLTPITRSIPHSWKVGLQAKRRQIQDQRSGLWEQFAPQVGDLDLDAWQAQVKIAQALKPSAYAANKWHNLVMAMQQIEPVVIHPGQIFSFWHAVGAPNEQNGYRAGRALMNNKLKAVIGRRVQYHEMILDGITAIAEGENPRTIENKLLAYMP